MRRWRLEDAPELRSTRGQPHERRTCPLQPQVRQNEDGSKETHMHTRTHTTTHTHTETTKQQISNFVISGLISYNRHTQIKKRIKSKALWDSIHYFFYIFCLLFKVFVCRWYHKEAGIRLHLSSVRVSHHIICWRTATVSITLLRRTICMCTKAWKAQTTVKFHFEDLQWKPVRWGVAVVQS